MKKLFSLILAFIFVFSLFAFNVFSEDETNESFPGNINAKAAVLMEVNSGKILYEYNAEKKLYPASVTKIMTILLTVEALENGKINLSDNVTCSQNAASKGGSQIWLEPNEVMTVDDLLKATVIGSANDAATLLGEYISDDENSFVELMNERAKELGMKNTNFVNATGLDDETDEHLTTAKDIGIMSCELLKHDIIRKYSTVWMDSLRNGKTQLVNTNKLVRFYSGTTGLKTGTTDKAGCCISASCERNGLHLVTVILGSKTSNDRFESAKSLLNWGFSKYCVINPDVDKSLFTPVSIIGGEEEYIYPEVPDIEQLLVVKTQSDNIIQKVDLCEDLQAPVEKGQKLGTYKIYADENCIYEQDIVSNEQIHELTLVTSIKRVICFLLTNRVH